MRPHCHVAIHADAESWTEMAGVTRTEPTARWSDGNWWRQRGGKRIASLRRSAEDGLCPYIWKPVWCSRQGCGKVTTLSCLDDISWKLVCHWHTGLPTDLGSRRWWQRQPCTSRTGVGPLQTPAACRTGRCTVPTACCGDTHAADAGPGTSETTTGWRCSDQTKFADAGADGVVHGVESCR